MIDFETSMSYNPYSYAYDSDSTHLIDVVYEYKSNFMLPNNE